MIRAAQGVSRQFRRPEERKDQQVVVLQRLARHQRALALQTEVVVPRPEGRGPATDRPRRHRRTTPS
jgi:hypothetical protein